MEATFLIFGKKGNSTARPDLNSAGAYTAPVAIYGDVDVLHPTLRVRGGADSRQLSTYNYCYIPKWSRYYRVQSWRYVGYDWVCDLEVDVLASWRDKIGSYVGYVLRSAAESDGTIPDAMYPMTAELKSDSNSYEGKPIFTKTRGCYSMVVLSEGAARTYVMGKNEFMALLQWLFSDQYITALLQDNGGWITTDPELRVTVNPAQYIQSVTYIPVEPNPSDGISYGNIFIGRAEYIVPPGQTIIGIPLQNNRQTSLRVSFPQHPQVSRGRYLNRAPYSTYAIDAPGFGVLDLPADLVAHGMGIRLTYDVDYTTGSCRLELWSVDPPSERDIQPFAVYNTNVGIPISISDLRAAGHLGAAAIVGLGASAAAAVLTRDAIGAVRTADSAIHSHHASVVPSVSAVGSQGGSTAISNPFVWTITNHYLVADEDNAHMGRPLCKLRKLSSLAGYQQVAHADVAISGYSSECEQVKNYLEGGYYYE